MTATRILEDVTPSVGLTESPVRALIRNHLGTDPGALPMLSETFPYWQDINVQTALDAYVAAPGRSSRLLGVSIPRPGNSIFIFGGASSLAGIISARGGRIAGVEYERQPCDVGKEMACIKTGLGLISGPEGPLPRIKR